MVGGWQDTVKYTSGVFTIMMGHMQVMGQFYNLFKLDLPLQFSKLLSKLVVLNFNFVELMSVACVAMSVGAENMMEMPSKFYITFLFKASIPAAIVLVVAPIYRWRANHVECVSMHDNYRNGFNGQGKLINNIDKAIEIAEYNAVRVVATAFVFANE